MARSSFNLFENCRQRKWIGAIIDAFSTAYIKAVKDNEEYPKKSFECHFYWKISIFLWKKFNGRREIEPLPYLQDEAIEKIYN